MLHDEAEDFNRILNTGNYRGLRKPGENGNKDIWIIFIIRPTRFLVANIIRIGFWLL
jgi:hypothetical protein